MLGRVSCWLALRLIAIWPSTRCFMLKRQLLKVAGHECGANVKICSSVTIFIQGKLIVGDDSWLGHEVMFAGGRADVRLGSRVDIAPRVLFATGTHELMKVGDRAAGRGYSLPIVLGDGVWVCAGATVLGGSNIGNYSVIAAGAVVRGEFPPRSLIGGVPARLIRTLEESDDGAL